MHNSLIDKDLQISLISLLKSLLGYISRSDIPRSYAGPAFSLGGTFTQTSIMAALAYILQVVCKGSPTFSPAFDIFLLIRVILSPVRWNP